MELRDKSILDLYINGEPAIDSLKKLDVEIDTLKKQQKALKKELDLQDLDPTKREELIRSYKEVSDKIQDTTKAQQMLRREMGLEELSIKELKGLLKDYRREWEAATDPALRDAMKNRIDTVNERLGELGVNVRKQEGMWGNFKNWVTGAFAFEAVDRAIGIVTDFVASSIQNFKKYDAAAAELSANTNIIGQDLETLKSKAKSLGPQMGMTADEMLKAYQLMGSAKSELTSNVEALDSVTQAAVTLSQAGKISLEDATTVMAASLNQFNAPASEAGRFINAISAGAQVGAAEIKDMGMALKASGTVAASMNVSFEQTNGVLQALSTVNIKGEQAGTAFRNILIKLASSSDDLNPKIVGIEKAFENLGKKQMGTTEMTKLFGAENLVAAEFLSKHSGVVTDFTAKLTGTSAAFDMATKNTETFEFQQKQAEAKVAALSVALGERLAPMITGATKGFNSFTDALMSVLNAADPVGVGFEVIWSILKDVAGMVMEIISLFTGLTNSSTSVRGVMLFLGNALTTVASGFRVVVMAVGVLVDAFVSLGHGAAGVYKILDGDFKGAADSFSKSGDAIANVKTRIVNTFDEIGNSYKKIYSGDWMAKIKEESDKSMEAEKKRYEANRKHILNTVKDNEDQVVALKKIAADHDEYVDKLRKNTAIKENNLRVATIRATVKDVDEQNKLIHESAQDLRAKLVKTAKAADKEISKNETDSHVHALTEKEIKAAEHRKKELDKATEQAKKEAEERLKATVQANKAIEKMQIEAIADEQTRKKKMMAFELEEKIATNRASKADDASKLLYEIALRGQYKTAVEKLEADYRTKHREEETKRMQAMFTAEKKKADDVAAMEFQTKKSNLELILQSENLNVNQRKNLQLQLQKLLYDEELKRINATAAAARLEALKTSGELMKLAGTDAEKKRQIEVLFAAQINAINNKSLADQTTANAKYQGNVQAAEEKALQARQAKQKGFFDAIGAMMKGDFTSFLDYLNKQLSAKVENLSKERQAVVRAADAALNIATQVSGALNQLNQLYLNRRISQITTERDTALAALKKQYDNGLLNKKDYEDKVAAVNKTAADREKAEKLKAFKRDQAMQIAMAVMNVAVAAVKSMAMLGWPLGLIGVAGAVLAGAIQIATIKAQRPPDFRSGGYIKNGGVAQGPRHGQEYGDSGISLTRRDTNEEIGEMEGDEPIMILSRNTYRNNGRLVDALIDSSLHQNGAPVKAEKGALFSDGGTYGDYLALEPFRKGTRYQDGRPAQAQYRATDEQGTVFANDRSENTSQEVEMNYGGGGGSIDGGGSVDSLAGNAQQAIDENVDLMKSMLAAIQEQKPLLEAIASATRDQANKPPIAINQITEAQNRTTDVATSNEFA